jgi:hypothetical protein
MFSAASQLFDQFYHHILHNQERYAEHDNMKWELLNKHQIARLLRNRAPQLNSLHYQAAAEVFPFRNNPYVITKLIDWYDFTFVFAPP